MISIPKVIFIKITLLSLTQLSLYLRASVPTSVFQGFNEVDWLKIDYRRRMRYSASFMTLGS